MTQPAACGVMGRHTYEASNQQPSGQCGNEVSKAQAVYMTGLQGTQVLRRELLAASIKGYPCNNSLTKSLHFLHISSNSSDIYPGNSYSTKLLNMEEVEGSCRLHFCFIKEAVR